MSKMTRVEYDKSIHRFGMITGWGLIFLMLAAPCLICTLFDIWPDDITTLFPAFFTCFMIMCPNALADAVAYPPLIGYGSVYLAALTGNTYNQKMPCALLAQKQMEVEAGSEEGDVVAQIAVCVATLVTTVVLLLTVFFGTTILKPVIESPVLAPAWNNVIPALLASLLITLMWGKVKYFVAPIAVAILCNELTTLSVSYYMIICIIVSLVVGMYFYKQDTKKIG